VCDLKFPKSIANRIILLRKSYCADPSGRAV